MPDKQTTDIAEAWRRAESVLQRRPESGLHDDSPATAKWLGGLRVESGHANGTRLLTDMPAELGGTGDRVTPGWLLRAGVASCTATCIAMAAAVEGFDLLRLEVDLRSRSDLRGMLGVADAGGEPVGAGPRDVELQVRIAARDVPDASLQALVAHSVQTSPMACALRELVPVRLQVEIEDRAEA